MAARFVLVLVLTVSGGAAGDNKAGLPPLKLRDVSMNGCGSFVGLLNLTAIASGISQSQRRVLVGGGGGLTIFCPDVAWQGLVDLMSKNGCGSFARLLSATAKAAEIFHEHLIGGGGITVFCPDDKAVAAFEPTFRGLPADDRPAVLLYHGVPACYSRNRFKGFNWVSLNTLAEDAATNKSRITVLDDGSALELWPSPPSYPNGAALVTKTVSEEAPLAVYVVDAVLLPSTVACIGYPGWLRCSISLLPADWIVPICIISVGGGMVGALIGVLIAEFLIPID